jgi:thiol-disulfide isomerase/thioredoxin
MKHKRGPAHANQWAQVLGLVVSSFALGGCEEEGSSAPVTRARSDAVVAAPGAAPQPAATQAVSKPASDAPAAPRGPLCASKPNTPLPKTKVSGMGSLTSPFAGGTPAQRGLTWVNLWAAWCEPCKKEIPLLFQFQKDLKAKGTSIELNFISIDDDPRQLQRFLDTQPPQGIKQTYWLKEGSEREEWLPEAGLSPDPRLPVHLLVNAEGQIFCRIEGSIEAGDLEAVRSAFTAL